MTYTELRDEIASQLGIESASTSELSLIFTLIKDVCRFLSTLKNRFLEATDTVSLVAGDYKTNLPTGFSRYTHPDQWLMISKDGQYYPLQKQSDEDFFSDFNSATTGMPTYYRLFAGEIWFKPYCDISYSLRREYIADITTPTLGGTVAIPDRYLQVLKSKVLLFASTYEEEPDKTAIWGEVYKEIIQQIKSDHFEEDYPERIIERE